ncbi:MAG TPA: hypothetical protein VEB59_08485, partial [Gemmatimonadales bacterium]|nr:hypothetical protein [Gemmatimonadales bacterium]
PPGGLSPLGFMAIPFVTILSFTALASVGLYYRRRSDIHRRVMLLATIAILVPAFARMRWLAGGGPRLAIIGLSLLIVVCMVYDRLSYRRIHPAFLWGGLALLISIPVRFLLATSDGWLRFAGWLTQ